MMENLGSCLNTFNVLIVDLMRGSSYLVALMRLLIRAIMELNEMEM